MALDHVARALCAAIPNVSITVDAVENRGFEYHSGITFSVFAAALQREIGRGGRYKLVSGEAATGATLLIDALLSAVPKTSPRRRLFVAYGTPRADILAWQGKGWCVVVGLQPDQDVLSEAKRLNCNDVLKSGVPVALN